MGLYCKLGEDIWEKYIAASPSPVGTVLRLFTRAPSKSRDLFKLEETRYGNPFPPWPFAPGRRRLPHLNVQSDGGGVWNDFIANSFNLDRILLGLKFLCRPGKWRSTVPLPLAIPRLIRCDYTKERMGRERERGREHRRASDGEGTSCAPLNSPKLRFQAVTYHNVPFHFQERSRAGRCERERERERGSRFKWISTLALLPIKRLASTLESSNGKIVETSAFLRDVRSEITVLELPFK